MGKDQIFYLEFNIGGDIHGTYSSNIDLDKLDELYKRGTEIIGFDFIKECYDSSNYERKELVREKYNVLAKLGILEEGPFEKEEPYIPYLWDFCEIYLEICKIGNPKFEFDKISKETIYIR